MIFYELLALCRLAFSARLSSNDKNGKPFVKSINKKIINENEFDFFLSLSDEIEYAHASVIIARKSSVV